jgi:N-acetylglucosamine-6-phosphate deacetylase
MLSDFDETTERGATMPKLAIKAPRVLTPLQDLRDAVVLIKDDRIEAVGRQASITIPEDAQVMDLEDKILVPGFVDVHNHGANGHWARDGAEAVKGVARWLTQSGTTSWLATVGSVEGVQGVAQAAREGTGGTSIPGIHCEGPFLSPKNLPGQAFQEKPLADVELYHQMLEAGEGLVCIMDCAPDLPGAMELIREIVRTGVTASCAHSKTDYDTFMRAVAAGIRHITHSYNVMSGMHHRRPGIVGGVLTCDAVVGELIPDGFHVHPVAMDVLIRCKGFDKVCAVTDSTPLAGLPDGEYDWFGRTVIKRNGISRSADYDEMQDGSMAGSEWPLNHDLRTLVDKVGVRLQDAVRMATLTPATTAGLVDDIGSLEPGKCADLAVIDDRVNVYLTMVHGQVVYQAQQ